MQKHYQRTRTLLTLVLIVALVIALSPAVAKCADARYWLSPFSVAPIGPEAPTVPGVQGNTRFLHIWAQPATVDSGTWDATNNPFRTLESISLNLSANDSVVDFLDESIIVHNPTLNSGAKRFEFTRDSTDGVGGPVAVMRDNNKIRIEGLQGFSISAAGQFAGIGPACHSDDPFCALTDDGSPAWLIASLAYTTTGSSRTANLFMEIGENGMNHVDGRSHLTDVWFGLNSGPYNAGPHGNSQCTGSGGNRQCRHSGDAPDMVAEAVATPAEFRWNGGNSNWTDANWNRAGSPSFTGDVVLDAFLGNAIVTVTGRQAANHTQVDGGELHFSDGAILASEVTVAAGGTVSGTGSIGSDLNLMGELKIESQDSLHVFGIADISNGRITVTSSYSQLPGTVSAPFAVLESRTGIVGSLITPVGEHLGGGVFLESMAIQDNALWVQLRTGKPGDYNRDGMIGAADYVVWRDSLGETGNGLASDGNNDRVVDHADYALWKGNYGSAVQGTSTANTSIPEPTSTTLLTVLAVGLLTRRANLV